MDRMAADGVESIIYVFYPNPVNNSTLQARLDVLRPLIQQTTTTSPIRTHLFLDLRPIFEGHYGEYVLSDGIHPTAAGSQATADAIWNLMRQNCIAQ
jgi:hypothetical protein